MRILLSNDDGIHSEGIWILAGQLSKIAEVVIVAPDREQSAVGTAVTLRKPLKVQKVPPLIPGINTYSVEGTPSDSVIVGLGKIVRDKVDLVVSGINHGSNLGEDVLISGTVGAAMAAYLRGFPAIAVSGERLFLEKVGRPYLEDIAGLTAALAGRIGSTALPGSLFLNVNMPGIPLAEVKGVKVTRLARKSHVNTVEEGNGEPGYYTLVRESVNNQVDIRTDIWAINQCNISITPLHLLFNERFPASLLDKLTAGVLEEVWKHN